MKRLIWPAAVVAIGLVAFDVLPAAYVFAPLLGLLILRIGQASFGSLRRGASYIPDGPPVAVDLAVERVVYWCGGCGAELLLLVRGTHTAPRHCGEKMTERSEIARQS
jgi:DNA-directed RNA polymerase subunit RPC12/RpoP